MLKIILIVLVCANLNFAKAAECKNKIAKNLCAEIEFEKGISRKADSSFILSFKNEKGEIVNLDNDPKIKLWMIMKGGHGHGSEKVKIEKINKKYRVTNVWFLMMGEWQVKLDLNYQKTNMKSDLYVCVGRSTKESFAKKCSN